METKRLIWVKLDSQADKSAGISYRKIDDTTKYFRDWCESSSQTGDEIGIRIRPDLS